MNCKIVNNKIEDFTLDDFIVGSSIVNEHDLNKHINSCSSCKKTLQEHHTYLVKLSNIQTPELSDNDATAMLNKFISNKEVNLTTPAKSDNSFLQGFIAASVLALSIFGAWNVFNFTGEQAPVIAQQNILDNTHTAPEFFTTEVVLIINAPEDMYDADLNIVLPQQIALEGYDNLQELNWAVDLKAGANTLSLPIRVNKHQAVEQPLSIMAKLYHYAEEREFEIKVDVEKIQLQQKNSAYLAPIHNTTRV